MEMALFINGLNSMIIDGLNFEILNIITSKNL